MAGSNNKVFTAVFNDKPASLANCNHRAFGLYRSDPPLRGMLLRCFLLFRAEPFTDVVVVLCLCCLFALLFLPLARAGEYLPLFGFHHFAMIVMNMDSNIKDNVEPVTWPTIETQLAYWSSRRRSNLRCAALRSWYGEPNGIGNAIGYAEHFSRSHDAVIRVYDHEHKGDFKEW